MAKWQPGQSGSPERVWKKGVSGNPKGRPKLKTLPEYARDYLDEINPTTGRTIGEEKAREWVAESVVSPALFVSLLDRLYGKVTDKLDVVTNGESLNIERVEAEHRLAALLDMLSKRA